MPQKEKFTKIILKNPKFTNPINLSVNDFMVGKNNQNKTIGESVLFILLSFYLSEAAYDKVHFPSFDLGLSFWFLALV